MTSKEKLFQIMYKKSFKYSPDNPFKLVSGNISPLYFDCKATYLDPKGFKAMGTVLFNLITEKTIKFKDVSCIGGMELGAIPIALSVVKETRLNPIIIRKKRKGHGTRKGIEGNFKLGDKAIVVDDVITTGGSTIEAIMRMAEVGLKVVHCIVLVDREEFFGRQKIEKLGISVISIFTANDFLKEITRC